MSWELRLFKRVVNLVLAVLLLVDPLTISFVYAEEEEITPNQTPVPQLTIITGDADTSFTTDTIVNNNINTIGGSLTVIDNNNQATVSGTINSSGNTGENTELGSGGDISIATGDATASGKVTNNINSNIEESPQSFQSSQTTSGSFEQTQSLTPTPEAKDLQVINKNDGEVENTVDISAITGSNFAGENLGNVDLKTGDALAWVNLLNVLNTNVVGGNFGIFVLDIENDSYDEINLNELWKQLQEKSNENSSNLRFVIANNNNAELKNEINVSALSGDNQANQNNSANIETGNATALANVINVINTNIFGTKFFFGIINITGQFKGNLILPRPELFENSGSSGAGGAMVFENQNTATVNDSVFSSADTGNNKGNNNGGIDNINIGNTESISTNITLTNLNLWQNNWFYLMMNVLGKWDGKTNNWSNPASEYQTGETKQIYQTEFIQSSASVGISAPSIEFKNENIAKIKNNIFVTAQTGENKVNENKNGTVINTGNAKASLNLINLINLNILSSNWFMGTVNILGNWKGNAVFAYPDVGVILSGNQDKVYPGSEYEYDLVFGNYGYDSAENVVVKVEFPKGLTYISDTSGISADCNVNLCLWNIGKLEKFTERNFKIRVKVDPNIESTYELTTKATIITSTPDSNNSNNTSTLTIFVDFIQKNESDTRMPVLEISAENNVNEFVYPGDTVTFKVIIKNTGDVRAENTYLTHFLYGRLFEDLGAVDIKIGTIEPGKTAKVTFGLPLSDKEDFQVSSYYTITKAIGFSSAGKEISSNEARTDFKIKLKEKVPFIKEKTGERGEKVLEATTVAGVTTTKKNILPYLVLFVLTSLCIIGWRKRMTRKIR